MKEMWKDIGYISISKKGTVLSVVVKHKRYIVHLDEAREVLDGKRNYALIYEYQKEK